MSQEKPTRGQRRIARGAEAAERLSAFANKPTTPWLLGKLAALEAWRQRPRSFEVRLVESNANMAARSRELSDQSHERFIASVGQLRRIKAGEPRLVSPSAEVVGFAHEQKIAEVNNQTIQPPQPPEAPEQQ